MAGDEDGAGAEVRARVEEFLRDDDDGGAAVGGGAALEFREGFVNEGGVEDLLEGVFVAELGVGVSLRVRVVDARDFGEVFFSRAVSSCRS